MGYLIATLVALAPFLVWGFKAYVASLNAAKDIADRKAGADARDNEANNAEIVRVENATHAGAAVERVSGGQTRDPNDRDGG